MKDGEQWLARTFVELADTLVDDFDVVDILSTLSERCADLLTATEVGVLIADHEGFLHVVGSSTERVQNLEILELQNDEGPCLDCYRSGEQFRNVILADSLKRWPQFAPAALASGLAVVHVLPMRLRGEVIGAVNIFNSSVVMLSAVDLDLAQALADVATIAIIQERAMSQAKRLTEQLQRALDSRIVIEQAKGVLAQQLGVSVDEAFVILRTHARRRNGRLSDVAKRVSQNPRSIDAEILAEFHGREVKREDPS